MPNQVNKNPHNTLEMAPASEVINDETGSNCMYIFDSETDNTKN